jgi:hypothetical protein
LFFYALVLKFVAAIVLFWPNLVGCNQRSIKKLEVVPSSPTYTSQTPPLRVPSIAIQISHLLSLPFNTSMQKIGGNSPNIDMLIGEKNGELVGIGDI